MLDLLPSNILDQIFQYLVDYDENFLPKKTFQNILNLRFVSRQLQYNVDKSSLRFPLNLTAAILDEIAAQRSKFWVFMEFMAQSTSWGFDLLSVLYQHHYQVVIENIVTNFRPLFSRSVKIIQIRNLSGSGIEWIAKIFSDENFEVDYKIEIYNGAKRRDQVFECLGQIPRVSLFSITLFPLMESLNWGAIVSLFPNLVELKIGDCRVFDLVNFKSLTGLRRLSVINLRVRSAYEDQENFDRVTLPQVSELTLKSIANKVVLTYIGKIFSKLEYLHFRTHEPYSLNSDLIPKSCKTLSTYAQYNFPDYIPEYITNLSVSIRNVEIMSHLVSNFENIPLKILNLVVRNVENVGKSWVHDFLEIILKILRKFPNLEVLTLYFVLFLFDSIENREQCNKWIRDNFDEIVAHGVKLIVVNEICLVYRKSSGYELIRYIDYLERKLGWTIMRPRDHSNFVSSSLIS